ncbi:MAG: DNA-binding protein [Bacteroidales bacterium]|nr:DNA-binding protein [Bacteroidales bacterium]
MINYSVYLHANPMDETASPKAYAKAQVSEVMSFPKFVKHIADHNGVYTRGTVKGVISDMCECLVEMLLEGKKVQLGELGNFWISLNSTGADSLTKFTAQNITAVNLVFTPGEDFENLRSKATFNPVSSRIVQAATLKAEKSGEGTVDLNAIKGKTPADNNRDAEGQD